MVTKPLNQPREPLEEGVEDFAQISAPGPYDHIDTMPPPEVTAERSGPAWRVLFHISSPQPSTVGLDVWRVTVLGRADPNSAFQPDLDFAPYGAMRYGVSRRHTLVRPGTHSLYLIDQNSTNGTWVNGQRLVGGREFPLSDGDLIELGALRMTLRIVQAPGDDGDRQQARTDPFFKRFRFGRSGRRH